MAIYECIIYDKNGKRSKVKLDFESYDELDSHARERELKLINVKKKEPKTCKKIKNKELSIICKQLGMLLSSGCEITQSLDNIKSNCSNKLKSPINKIDYHLRNGSSISSSFQKTNLFSNFFINMIEAGEKSGKLDEILLSLFKYYKKEYEFKSKLITALIYPVILLIITTIMIIIMITCVTPNFESSFLGTGVNLPISTRMLIEISKIIRNYYVILIFTFTILLISSYTYISKNEKLKIKIQKKLFKLKFIGNIIQSLEVIKFTRSFYTLLSSGIHIMDALNISAKTISNKYMYEKLYISKDKLEKGCGISESLDLSGVFPNIFISMLKVGEESGEIENSLHTIMINYESDMDTLIQKILKIIGPIIIVIMATIIGAIVISIMIPMFDAVTAF